MSGDRGSTYVIVGGGLAGAEAARMLRSESYDGRLVLVAEERHAPYERPPLSKEYLRGEADVAKLLAQPEEFYETNRIELHLGRRAIRLDPGRRRVALDDGREIEFDRLLLATGASPRRLPGDDGSRPWVHYLRTIDDADRLRSAASTATSAVVAGGGWIAAEAAASLRQLGVAVTLAIPGREVLEKTLGPEVGARYSALHRRHDVRVVEGARVVGFIDEPATHAIRLASGDVLAADLVVLGLGASPNIGLAEAAGLAVGDGVLVDERLVTESPAIFAAGDVASAIHPRYGRRLRSQHWDNARRQGRAAARNMLGRDEPYDRVPYLYSDQFELGMELIGHVGAADTTLVRDVGADSFVALWLAEGRVVAGMHGNAWDLKKPLDRLVSAQAQIDGGRFSDPGVPLEELGLGAVPA